jgi:hypothetical protein
MKQYRSLALCSIAVLTLAGCNNTLSTIDYQPIPGSITYKGQPRSKLTKVPIGSTFSHEIRLGNGDEYHETYQVQPDRSLKIIRRVLHKERLFPL